MTASSKAQALSPHGPYRPLVPAATANDCPGPLEDSGTVHLSSLPHVLALPRPARLLLRCRCIPTYPHYLGAMIQSVAVVIQIDLSQALCWRFMLLVCCGLWEHSAFSLTVPISARASLHPPTCSREHLRSDSDGMRQASDRQHLSVSSTKQASAGNEMRIALQPQFITAHLSDTWASND